MTALFTTEQFYAVVGVILAIVAARIAANPRHPKRWGSALFWILLAVVFLGGPRLPDLVSGYLVLAMGILAATRQVGRAETPTTSREERAASAAFLGNGVFWPALLIPGTAILGALVLAKIHFGDVALLEPKQASLVALGLGTMVALVAGMVVTGARWREPAQEGTRLLEAVGWALILPQLLAALGGIFARAGVGAIVADLVTRALPTQLPFVAVAAYCCGMALFTVIMGNAFAAFPVITLGVGLPLIVQQHHGNPAIMAALGMLSGYCGTLLTPMAANFNLVPVMLLELPDKHAVIRAQAPIAGVLLAWNILLMYACVFRF